jgi:UDP-N-acetylglucosamine/UDP-N-acetylgalactosamine 4-epimerase
MKILVTGAAGFIGSNLCEFFLQKGHDVVGLDNFSTGFSHNIVELEPHPKFLFIEGDIRSPEDCQKAVKGIDVVLHQAALGSVPRSLNDPATTNAVNISGFVNMLEACRNNGVERFIYAASSSTYGDSTTLPKVEDKIGNPLSPYAVTKYVNELYASVYARSYGLKTIGLRYFNVFGRRQDPNGAYAAVIPKFIGKILKGENPTINGDGSYSRDFTFIDNVLHMNYLAVTTSNEKAFNQVYNTAVGGRITILQMAEYIIDILQKKNPNLNNIAVDFGPKRNGDVSHSQACIKKGNIYLGYKPTHNFFEGIESSINWYIKNLIIY